MLDYTTDLQHLGLPLGSSRILETRIVQLFLHFDAATDEGIKLLESILLRLCHVGEVTFFEFDQCGTYLICHNL